MTGTYRLLDSWSSTEWQAPDSGKKIHPGDITTPVAVEPWHAWDYRQQRVHMRP